MCIDQPGYGTILVFFCGPFHVSDLAAENWSVAESSGGLRLAYVL